MTKALSPWLMDHRLPANIRLDACLPNVPQNPKALQNKLCNSPKRTGNSDAHDPMNSQSPNFRQLAVALVLKANALSP